MEIKKTEEIVKDTNSGSGFKLTTPVAILIGFVLISAAIFFGQKSSQPSDSSNEIEVKGVTTEILEAKEDENIFGNENADLVLITYSDSDCPHCATLHGYMEEILNDNNYNVAWYYRHFPIKPNALNEAIAFECVVRHGGENDMWDYLSKLIGVTMPPEDPATGEFLLSTAKSLGVNEEDFKNCFNDPVVQEKIDSHHIEAITAGGQGTPFNIIVNKKTKQYEVIAGVPRTKEGLLNILDAFK